VGPRRHGPAPAELDPRWDWIEVSTWGDPGPLYVKGACRHVDVVPVESVVDGQVLAQLCLTCDAQLPGLA
jgi:hypothetical protein